MTAAGDGFLSRWARRKADARSDAPAAADAAAAVSADATVAMPQPTVLDPPPAAAAPAAVPAEAAPLPTLADVARLTHASDYSPYVAENVDARVRNAAMKKLFSDPHFNVMDGLDTYIDDYGKPDPIPLSMLRKMNQSIALGLFADEPEVRVPDDSMAAHPDMASPDGDSPATMAQSALPAPPPAEAATRADDDPDLQLQPDDPDRRPRPESGPRG